MAYAISFEFAGWWGQFRLLGDQLDWDDLRWGSSNRSRGFFLVSVRPHAAGGGHRPDYDGLCHPVPDPADTGHWLMGWGFMAKRASVTVGLLPLDADWLRQRAEDHGVTLSEALREVVGTARVREGQEAERWDARQARLLRANQLSLRVMRDNRQLDFFVHMGVMH